MKKRFVAIAMAAAVVFAIPVVASAQEGEDAPDHVRPPIAIEDKYETVEEAVTAITERLTSALERVTERYANAQENEDVPEEVLAHMAEAIDALETTIGEVAGASDFDELNSILEDAREQRRELRANRPHRPGCGGFPRGGGADTGADSSA